MFVKQNHGSLHFIQAISWFRDHPSLVHYISLFHELHPHVLTIKAQTSPNPFLRLSSQTSWERLPIYKIERVENGCQMDTWWKDVES